MIFLDHVDSEQLVEQEIQNGVGKVSQSLISLKYPGHFFTWTQRYMSSV